MSSYMFWGIFKQHVSSFNYEKIRTTGAVLVAISIPIFNSQLEKSREAVDAANIRAAYAEITADALTGKTDTTKTITPKQTNAGWQTKFDFPEGLVTKTGSESTKIVNSTNVTLAWENNQVTVTCSLAQETK